jgi:hypothetical protein
VKTQERLLLLTLNKRDMSWPRLNVHNICHEFVIFEVLDPNPALKENFDETGGQASI